MTRETVTLETTTHDEMSAGANALAPFKDSLLAHFPSAEEIFARAEQQQRTARQNRNAATVIAIAALVAMIWAVDPVYRRETFQTAIGEHRVIELADGSRLALNTDSSVQVQWRLRRREFDLLRGEAAFTVAHGPRSFIVTTGTARVRDIGTAFNIRTGPQSTDVSVLDGAVEVTAANGAVVLHQNQRAAVVDGALQPATASNADVVAAWQHGKLVFDGAPLSMVVAELQRYRSAPITLTARDSDALRLSGEFDSNRIEALLDLLPAILPVTVQRAADGSISIGTPVRKKS